MFVSVFAVLALALSAVAAPPGVSPTGTGPNVHDAAKNDPHAHGVEPAVKGLPIITSPNAHDVWRNGQEYNVSWDCVTAELQNKTGVLVLGHPGAALDYEKPLMKDVPVNKGWVMVKANGSEAGDFVLALTIADLGEAKSPQFTIQSA